MNKDDTFRGPGSAYERLVAALREHGCTVVDHGDRGAASTPGHSSADRGTTFRRVEDRTVVHCHNGDTGQMLADIGLSWADLYDNPRPRYEYPDGRLVTRYYSNGRKKFHQDHHEGKRALFGSDRLPQDRDVPVLVLEGEADVITARSIGYPAVTQAQGASTPPDRADWEPLRGRPVWVVADRDERGRARADKVAAHLRDIAARVVIAEAKAGNDFSDHIAAGYDVNDLVIVGEVRPARRARLTWANEIQPEPVVWAWEDQGEGRIPAGTLSIAAGREGTGKSSFGIWKAAQITNGELPGAWFGQRRPVFYLAVEDSWKHTLVPRLMAAGADLSRIGRFEVVDDTNGGDVVLSLPQDNALLEQAITEHGAALVVIDPLMSVIGERIDTHREREVRSALDPLARLADRTGAVILGIAHFNKGSGADISSLITGSGAFKNVPRSVFGFARDESDQAGGRVMTQSKNSLGRDDLPSLGYRIETAEISTPKGIARTGRFVFTGETDRTVSDILRESARIGSDDEGEHSPAQRFILRYIREHADENGEVPARDVFTAGEPAGYTEKDLTKARARCKEPKIATRKQGFGKGSQSFWSIDASIDSIDSNRESLESMGSMTESIPSPAPEDTGEATGVTHLFASHERESTTAKPRPGDPCQGCGNGIGYAGLETGICRRCQTSTTLPADDGAA